MGKARITYRFDQEAPQSAPDKGDFSETSAAHTKQWTEEWSGAWTENRADQPLNRAEQPLKRADQPLKRAEQQLHRAEQSLQREDQPMHRTEQSIYRVEQPMNRADQPIHRAEQPMHHAEQSLHREGQSLHWQDESYIRDFGAWKSPYDAEAERIEQLIRQSGEERSYRAVEGDEEEHAILHKPAAKPFVRSSARYVESGGGATYRKKTRPSSWLAMSASLAGAILTGVVLGLFVLSIFRGDAIPDQQSDAVPEIVRTQEHNVTDSVGEEQVAAVMEGLQPLALNLQEQTYYFVQFGVFSSSDGAELAQEQLRAKGLAGATLSSDKHTVFAGAAASRDDALLLSHQLQNEQLEVFIKPFVLPAVGTLLWEKTDISGERLAQYVADSRLLAGQIFRMAAIGVNEAAASSLAADTMTELKKRHQQWLEQANALVSLAPPARMPLLEQLNTAMNSAVLTLEQYEKRPDTTYLWQAQAQAAEALIVQQKLLDL